MTLMNATTKHAVSSLWRSPAVARSVLMLAFVALTLSGVDSVRAQSPAASTLVLVGDRQRAVGKAQAVNYHIQGDATIIFDYSSEAGLQELAKCHASMVPKWHLVLDGTLDSVGQNMTGTFAFTGIPMGQWQQWDSALLQCGSEMRGQTSCHAGCGPYWIQYRYNATAVPTVVSTFQGTYANGKVEILGSAFLGSQFIFEDCFNAITGATTPCEQALGFTPGPIPEAIKGSLPRNAKTATTGYGVRSIVISGDIVFTEGGVSIRANMNLPESEWADCCIVSDPLFLSDKNHVSISGAPVGDPIPLPPVPPQ
jgi:hypothetical protein